MEKVIEMVLTYPVETLAVLAVVEGVLQIIVTWGYG